MARSPVSGETPSSSSDAHSRTSAVRQAAGSVQADVDDALALGILGTSTFFLDGRPFEPTSVEDFTRALDGALGR